MKNSNLLNRLLSYSHEKQSPQRFARYAAMLIMLLTLGVGQMWASTSVTVYCAINASTMKSGDNCYTLKVNANIGDNNTWVQTGMSIVDHTKSGKLIYSATFTAKYDGVDALQFQLYQGSTWKGQQQPYSSWTGESTFNGKMYDYDANTWSAYSGFDDSFTIYFVNTSDWATPKAFAWSGCTNNAAWSGQTMTSTGKSLGGKTIYYINSNKRYENIIFSNNGADQTADLTLGATNAGKMYDNGTWKTYQFDITLDPQSGSGGTSSVTGVVGSAMPGSKTAPTRSGYIFGGYYTGTDGSGTCYYNASMVSQTNVSASTPNTLYAKWIPVTWKLQSTLGDHGTFTGTGPYTLDVTYNSATMNWGAARFDLNGTSYICNNYTIGTSGKLDLRAENAYTGITGMTNGASYTFTITYESGTWYVQIAENCTAPTIAWNTPPANGVAGGNMTASVTTNQTSPTITWNSSNTSAATVNSSGVITYVAAGNTRITASYTGDGSTYCSTTASVYQDITVSAAVADVWSLWYLGGSETKIGDFTPDGGDSHHLDFELTVSNFQTLWLKNNSTQYVATNINANTVTNVTVTESPAGRFRDDATKGYYRFTIYKDGGGAWKLDASPIYRVTYNDNGATSGTAPTDAAGYVSGATVTVKGNTGSLAKTGYDFGGWNLSANGSGTNYTAGSGTFSITANTELFAKWNAQNYSIIYKDQGDVAFSGSHVDSPSAHPTTHTYGTATGLSSATKTGYTFGGWFTTPACTGEAVTSLGATTYSDDITLYAKWTENMTTVTINANPAGAGTFTVGGVAFSEGGTITAGVATSRTVVTTAQPGYKFSSWGTSGNATGTSSTNTYTLKGNGSGSTGTLTANFSRLYAYVQGRFQVKDAARSTTTTTYGSGGQWDASSTKIQMDYDNTNHRFVLHTHMTPSELTATHGTGCDDCKPYFFIKTSTSNSSLAGVTTYMCTSAQTLTTAGSANGKTVSSSSGSNTNLRFNSSTTSGYAVVYFDQSKIWYELEQRLQYDANGGSGTAPTGDNGHNSYHAKDANATAEANTFTARKNYTFAGWNTAADITGTSYAAGASVPMSADRILYAKWNRSVTLDQQDATTPGSTSVIATWNCSTLPTINNPEKTGYDFGGWYTETAGNGNIIINTSGQLQANKTNWTVDGGKFQRTPSSDASESKPLYAKWTQTVTLNANIANHGSGDNTSATIVYKATAKTSITQCTPATGYHLEGYYTAATDGVKVLNADGSFAESDVTDYITDGKWTKAGATTLYAHYEPNTYDVILNVNGATSGSDQTVVATFDDDMPTTQKTSGDAITAPSKTGYTFGGYYANTNGTGTQYYTSGLASSNVWDVAINNTNIYAKWTANPYTVTLDIDEDNHGTIASKTTSQSVTYDGATSDVATLPTAANGYALDGYYTDQLGEGTKLINADGTWIASVDGYTDGDAKWVHVGDVTLYAYYKKAVITGIALSSGTVLPNGSVTATATIEPTPTPTTIVCWKLLYNNGTEYSPQPTFTPAGGNVVSFNAPEASGTYKVQAQLRTGGVCGSGTLLSESETSFVVAGTHNVTIQYKCGDVIVKSSTVVEGVKPLEWSETITPGDEPFGYTFARWEAGDGVSITDDDGASTKTTTTSSSIKIKAIYDGRLTAVYTKKNIIYFKNTLGWSEVYVNLYPYAWWSSTKGAGNQSLADEKRNKLMTQLGETDIWYYEYGNTATTAYVSFTDRTQNNYEGFAGTNGSNKVQVSYPTRPDATAAEDANYGFNAGTPMFVPIEQTAQPWNQSGGVDLAEYYNKGYWRAYDPTTGESGSTGYTLKIYNQTEGNSSRELLQSIPFTNTDASGQIFKATTNLEAAKGYGIKVERDNSLMYTNTEGHLHRTGDVVTMSVNPDNYAAIWIKSTAAGDYDFIITCNGSGQLCLQATFPAADNDYRVLYTDNATWSNAAHVKQTWVHPSRVISAAAGATDTISFFVSKDNSPEYKIQRVSGIDEGTGAITWADVTSWTSISVAKTGVYNFIFNQPAAGSISLSKTEEYDGNFYIRTDNAGSTKWENYRAEDHKMTYSEYAAKVSHADVSMDFTHYFMKFVDKDKESGKYKNVKFTIANDYSACISDTLIQQTGDIAPSHVNASGDLQANANIRFMWNIKNNKLQRAYLAAAQSDGTKFLVLQGKSGELLAPDGTALSNANGNNHDGGTDAIQFTDKEHWMYDAEVKAVPGGRVKLYAVFNGSTFYYYGDGDASFDGSHAIELISGSGGAQDIRVIYDFKTDRLIAAWVPSDGDINAPQTINADIMLIREHQNAGKQINLTGTGSISTDKTVYGVMRFNRWTLNNKSTTNTGTTENPVHAVLPVGEQKSQYERFNYMISFPFDVKVGEIFGFGTIGRHYRIYYYDGLGRAKEGFFAERGDDNWRMIDDTDSILHANQGYLLQLNYIRMADDNTATWPQKNMNEVELYFPAMNEINTIQLEDVVIPALGDAYKCKINLQPTYHALNNPDSVEADRRVKDSYWRCIGVPGFTSYLADAGTWVNFNWKAETDSLPYLYEWQMDDNKLSVVSSATFTFKPMHAYLIQNGKSFTWTSVAHPTVAAAPRRSAADEGFYEFYLEMQNGEQALDHTYVRLTDKENITADFDFGQDLSKELNSGANIFTKVGYERLAANNLPLSEQTTIVPVGVKIASEDNYTFAMPEGTHGVGVTLVDNETGDRTNLSLFDYSVNLTKGDYDNRFILEISPIVQSPTGIELLNGENGENGVRKVLIDNILYIVKDGIVYDAQGHRVQ